LPCSASTVRDRKRSSITLDKNSARAFHDHPPRFYAAPNFLKMGIKMSRIVVFWTTSTIKDEKSAAKFHYIKTVSRKVVAHSIAFRVASTYWQGRPLLPEILPPSDLRSTANGILGEMSELITQEQIAVGFSNFVDGLIT